MINHDVSCIELVNCFCFLFQAEDGIRDLVRSRGLGDVYKRQEGVSETQEVFEEDVEASSTEPEVPKATLMDACGAVSYTHLTLPTSDLV